MRLKASILARLLSVLLVGCGSQDTTITVIGMVFDEARIAQGRQLYAQNCASCYGANGEGQLPNFPLVPDETERFGALPHNGYRHTSHHPDN